MPDNEVHRTGKKRLSIKQYAVFQTKRTLPSTVERQLLLLYEMILKIIYELESLYIVSSTEADPVKYHLTYFVLLSSKGFIIVYHANDRWII